MTPPIVAEAFRSTRTRDGAVEVACAIRDERGELPATLWFRVHDHAEPLEASADPFGAALAIGAMALGRPVHVAGAMSASLVEGLRRVARQYADWSPSAAHPVAPVPLEVETIERRRVGAEAASFFSGGLDSFYTLLRNLARYPAGDARRIQRALLVHGFDVPLDDAASFARVRDAAARVTEALDVRLTVITTNVRDVLRRLDWDIHGHGVGLAATGLALGPLLHTVYIPSSGQPLSANLPNAVHPSLVPWWSTEGLEFVSDGGWATRTDKTRVVVRSAVAREHLRVCWERPGGGNCGACEKCLRTMVDLHLAGALAACRTFPATIDAARIRTLRLPVADHPFWREMLTLLRATGRDGVLAEAVEMALARATLRPSRADRLDASLRSGLARVGLTGARLKRLDERLLGGAVRRSVARLHRRALSRP